MCCVYKWRLPLQIVCNNIIRRTICTGTLRKTFLLPFSSLKKINTCNISQYEKIQQQKNKNVMLYITAIAITVGGLSYAAVPMYRIFCQATGLGGQAILGHDADLVATMERLPHRKIRILFNADTSSSLQWNFKPQQIEIKISPGETALAFYTATNPTDKPIVGISTYNVIPFEAGPYFNKIQCFCFEEQRLNPHEKVDMPVFFYIDPEFADDPKMEEVNTLTLSYTFFEAKEGMDLSFLSQNRIF